MPYGSILLGHGSPVSRWIMIQYSIKFDKDYDPGTHPIPIPPVVANPLVFVDYET